MVTGNRYFKLTMFVVAVVAAVVNCNVWICPSNTLVSRDVHSRLNCPIWKGRIIRIGDARRVYAFVTRCHLTWAHCVGTVLN